MRKILTIILLCCLLVGGAFAKDPMKRGKAQFPSTNPYPQVDVSGYEEVEYNSLELSGDPNQYQNSAEYLGLPSSVKVYDGLRHRRLIDLEGQINEKLYVRYKILQEPDLPQETDIYVEYDKFSIYFGKYDATLSNGELFSITKGIDGLHTDYIDKDFQLEGIYGEERSHQKTFAFNGTGKKDYSLGQTNILEGSIKIRLNGYDLPESEYYVDYYEGRITFTKILSVIDSVEGSYEYMDPIEDFLPISSRVRLTGIQHKYKAYTSTPPVVVTKNTSFVYQPSTAAQEAQPLWQSLITNTQFTYHDKNLSIQVQNPELTGVSVYLEDQPVNLKKDANGYKLEFPSSTKARSLALTYQTEKYSFTNEFNLSFQEAEVTRAIQIEETVTVNLPVTVNAPASVNMINMVSVNNQTSGNILTTANLLLVKPQITGNVLVTPNLPTVNVIFITKIITENGIQVIKVDPEGYKITLPEGLVIFRKDGFLEGNYLKLDFLPAVPSISEVSIQLKNEQVPLKLDNEGYHLNYALTDDFTAGTNYAYLIFKGQDQNVNRRVFFQVFRDNGQPEHLEKIELPQKQLVSFTEELVLNDNRLVQNKDYKVDYQNGEIRFLKEVSPDARLTINYVYKETGAAVENIKGNNSQGPYKLLNRMVAPGSVRVKINDLIFIEGQDFKVNYDDGSIAFARKLKEVETAEVAYNYYAIAPGTGAGQTQENFSISSYFVQEQAKAAEASAEQSQSLGGGDLTVTANNNVTTINIPIGYLPIIRNSLKLFIGGVATTNFVLSEFDGVIVITGNNYTADQLKVDFNYGKAVLAPKFSFVGNSRSTIIMTEQSSNFPRPMIFGDKSSIVIEHKSKDSTFYSHILELNRDFIVGYETDLLPSANSDGSAIVNDDFDAWDRGVITFITRNAVTGYSTYSGFDNTDQFRLTYKISDTNHPDPGDVLHQTYGTKINYLPTDYLNVGVEYNESYKAFQRTIAQGSLITSGDGTSGQTIQLVVSGNPNLEIVEDSEQVYINGRLKTRNDDYSIAYVGGLIRFKTGVVLNPQDIIAVNYQYFSTGVGESEDLRERAKAVKVDTTVRLPQQTDVSLTYVTVDSKYDPVGNPPPLYPAGTEAKKITITSQPLSRLNLYSKVEDFHTKVGEFSDDSSVDRYQDSLVQQYKLNYGFNQNDNVSFIANRSDVKELADQVDTSNYAIDTTAYDEQMNLGIGPDSFRTDVMVKTAEAFTGVLDRQDGTRIYNRNASLGNIYKPLSNLSFNSNYAQNIDDEFTSIRKDSTTKFYSELIRYTPWTIDTSVEYSAADYFSEQSISDQKYYDMVKTIGRDRKQVYNLTFRRPNELSDPLYEELYLHFDDTYSNTASDLHNQLPDITRADNFNFTLRPYDLVSFGYDDRYSRAFLENRNREDYMQEDRYRFNRFYLTKYIKVLNPDFLIMNKVEFSRKRDESRRSGLSYNNNFFNDLNQGYTLNPLDNLSLDMQFAYKNTERLTEEYSANGVKETTSKEPGSSYGLDADYNLSQLFLLKSLKATWTRDFTRTVVHSSIKDTTGVITNTKDDYEKLSDNLKLKYNYLNAFTNTHALTVFEEFKQKSVEGSRYTYGHTDQLDTRYDTPITGLGLTYSLTKVYDLQYTNPSETISRYSLDKFYDNKLFRLDDTNKTMADYTPFPEITLDTSYYTRHIYQDVITGRKTGDEVKFAGQINSSSYEFGATYRPFQDFASRFGWRKNVFDLGFGEESKLTIDYKPLKFELGELTYHFENTFNYGKGTNDPEQEFNRNELQGFVQTTVTDRNDIKVVNTLILKINKDIANVIVNNMLVDVNLTRLHLWDRENPQFSYSVNSFYAKGTLNF